MHLNPGMARRAWWAALALTLAYGGLLRLDAISAKFDPVAAPRWLHRLEIARAGSSALRPAAMRWDVYPRYEHKDGPPSQFRSDPYTYLKYAREMQSFYAAHRREPLIPFETKVWLWLLHDDDSAVSFASAAFSVLAIALTFALGSEAFSPAVGLLAALLWAIEFDVIDNGTEGWRDDAFACAVVLTAWLMIRLARKPDLARAVALGLAAGAACLIRITALSFVIPGLLYLLLTLQAPWRERLRTLAAAAIVALLVVGPFLVNCWRAYGDPLHAINVHADVYRATEGQSGAVPQSTGGYIASHLRDSPVETIDTFALGLTRYPFANKWRGFDVWLAWLGPALSAAALCGLFLFTAVPAGRVLLVVLVSSLVPYAVTWRLIFDWRFTEIAYPFFLIAAASPIWFAARAIEARRTALRDRALVRRTVVSLSAAAVVAVAVWAVFWRVTPPVLFERALRAGTQATVMAGDRDGSFFGGEWSRVVRSGTIATRVAAGARATMEMPLPAGRAYDVLLRVDPSQAPMLPGAAPQRIQLLLNGRLLGACDPQSLPDRVGICRFTLPADAVRGGVNRMTLVTEQPSGFRVWYARVSPAG